MPEKDREGKNYYPDVPQKSELFYLKGCNELGWGMKNRLARIFRPEDGRTIMLAVDHGYFQGPTTGLERIDIGIMPLVPLADSCSPAVPSEPWCPRPSPSRSSSGRLAARAY